MFRLCSKGCIYTGCCRWPTFFFPLTWHRLELSKERVSRKEACESRQCHIQIRPLSYVEINQIWSGYLSSKQTEWIFSDAEKGASLLMHITAANTQVLIRAHLLSICPETWIVSFSPCLLSARTVHNTLAQAREGMKLLRYVRVTVFWTKITDSSSDSWNIFKMTWSCEL